MILITGGTGFIGSHTSVELIQKGKEILIIDNLSNSNEDSLDRIESITGRRPGFVKLDLLEATAMEKLFQEYNIESVIHFAGLKAVGESNEIPLKYYENNISGTVNLLNIMAKYNVKKLVFSSSATVYGTENSSPMVESMPTEATNPYGRTKLFIEHILNDLYKSDNNWKIAMLRYFNPVGAHESGKLGEFPNGKPNNIMPNILNAASNGVELQIYGKDYNTADGTCIRDYIHIKDLAVGHIKALDYLDSHSGIITVNLGTGKGCSVLELITAFEKTAGVKLKYKFVPRRAGDIAVCYANTKLAKELLNWKAEKTIEDMCRDSWRWQCYLKSKEINSCSM